MKKFLSTCNQKLFEIEGRNALKYLTNFRKYNEEMLKETEFCFWTSDADIRSYLLTEYPDAEKNIATLPLSGHNGDIYDLAIPYRNRKGIITGFIKRSIKPGGEEIKNPDGSVKEFTRYDSTKGISKHDLFNLDKMRKKETF